jgi:pectate lyase
MEKDIVTIYFISKDSDDVIIKTIPFKDTKQFENEFNKVSKEVSKVIRRFYIDFDETNLSKETLKKLNKIF